MASKMESILFKHPRKDSTTPHTPTTQNKQDTSQSKVTHLSHLPCLSEERRSPPNQAVEACLPIHCLSTRQLLQSMKKFDKLKTL